MLLISRISMKKVDEFVCQVSITIFRFFAEFCKYLLEYHLTSQSGKISCLFLAYCSVQQESWAIHKFFLTGSQKKKHKVFFHIIYQHPTCARIVIRATLQTQSRSQKTQQANRQPLPLHDRSWHTNGDQPVGDKCFFQTYLDQTTDRKETQGTITYCLQQKNLGRRLSCTSFVI